MSSIVLSKDCCFAAPFSGFILTFLCLDKMESFSLDSATDPGLHEVMDEL